jgi:hypothetical protein
LQLNFEHQFLDGFLRQVCLFSFAWDLFSA